MKKTMVCLAAAALCAGVQAQTTVELMGLADVYVGSMQMAGDATHSNRMGSGGMTTSWWGFKGTEDLGGGLKANMAMTGFLRMDSGSSGRFTGDTMFSRDASISLSGGFGSVLAGRGVAPNFLPTVIFNPFGDSFAFSPLILHTNVSLRNATAWASNVASDTGWSSQLVYGTPTIGGVKANLHYQLVDVAGASGKKNVGANAFYSAGPVGMTAFYERSQLSNPVLAALAGGATRTNWMLGGSYDEGVAKGYLTYGETKSSLTTAKAKTTTLGAAVPVGGGKVLAALANTRITGGNTRDTVTVGYDYFLSKRTDVYANLMHDKITGFTSGTSVGVGVRHRF